MMNIGLIGFGDVNRTFAKYLKNNHHLFTSIENRSENTINNIKKEKIRYFNTDIELAENSDLLISANTPKSALPVAKKYSKIYNKLYLDLNNINPSTTKEIHKLFKDNFIDGAIIGNIKKLHLLLLSGYNAEKLLFCNDFIKTRIISKKPSDASKLKMLRSTYTKGVSALLTETFTLANKEKLDNNLWEILEITENTNNFKQNSQSRIKNTQKHDKRKIEEMEEIIKFFEGTDLSKKDMIMINATYSKFKN